MSRRSLLKRLALVVGVLFAAVHYVAWVRLGGAAPFPDLNPLGATSDQIFAFRDRLGDEGRVLFREVYLILDFALLAGVTLLLCAVAQALKPKRFWWLIIGFAVIYCVADMVENTQLAQLVAGVPQSLEAMLAERINLATRVKFAALLLAAASLITCWRQDGG